MNKVSDVAVGEVGKDEVYLHSSGGGAVSLNGEGRRTAVMTSNVLAVTSQWQSSIHPLFAVGAGVGWGERTSVRWVPLTH